MQPSAHTCPHCRVRLAPQTVLTYRPFGCPVCGRVIEPESYLGRYGRLACVAAFIAGASGLIALGIRWYLSLPTALAGAILITVAALEILRRLRPGPALLGRYDFRLLPQDSLSLADFLDSIAAANAWSTDFDRRLAGHRKQVGDDDWLAGFSIELASRYRNALQGVSSPKLRLAHTDLDLEGIRQELRAIARDLRGQPKSPTA